VNESTGGGGEIREHSETNGRLKGGDNRVRRSVRVKGLEYLQIGADLNSLSLINR